MEFEFDGYLKTLMERLLQEVEEMGRRQEALETLTERIIAEQEEIRRRQDDLMREWEDFGKRLNVYSAAWGAHLDRQMKQLEDFAQQLAALLSPETPPEEY